MIKNSLKILLLVVCNFTYGHVKDTIIEFKFKSSFIASNNPDSLYHYVWNTQSQSWSPDKRSVFSYTDDASKESEENSNWQDENWVLTERVDYVFTNDLLEKQISSRWDRSYYEWVQYKSYNFVYDTINNLIQNWYLRKNETAVDWINDSLYEFKYNSLNQLSEYNDYKWSFSSESWNKNTQTIYSYDSIGNKIGQILYLWESELLIWEPLRSNIFIYNQYNQLIIQRQLTINNSSKWVNDWKREYYYYENGLLKDEIYFRWSLNADDWIEDYKVTNYFDENTNLLKQVGYYYDLETFLWNDHYQILNEFYAADLIETSTFYYWNFGRWNELEKDIYNYPGYVSVNNFAEIIDVNVYPNPAQNILTISYSNLIQKEVKVQFYDIGGKIVYCNTYYPANSNFEVKLPDLPNGVFLMKLIDNNVSITKKIVIFNR